MTLSVAVQMDPIASINPAGDSTFAMQFLIDGIRSASLFGVAA